jgi:hypothetical protein
MNALVQVRQLARRVDEATPPQRDRAADALRALAIAGVIGGHSLGLLFGRVPGLLSAPTHGIWVAERLAWLPVFATVLAGLWLVFRRVEH